MSNVCPEWVKKKLSKLNNKQVKITCEYCGEDFCVSPSRANKRKTCSIGCKAKLQIGKPAWNKGLPRTWKSSGSFKKGMVPWNKGKNGYRTTKKGKRYPQYSGEKSGSWKGGLTKQNKLERSRFTRTISQEVFERDDYTCQICGAVGEYFHADHIIKWSKDKEKRFDMTNCRTLCRPCHYLVTFGKEMPPKSRWGLSQYV